MTRVFERLKAFFQEVAKLFTKNDIQRIVGPQMVVTDKMLEQIGTWRAMLAGKADWVTDYVVSLRLERAICREFANVAVLEMESSVTVPRLDAIYQKAIADLREDLQDGLGLGSMILKPLGGSRVECVPADRFVPLAFDDEGQLVKVCFIAQKRMADDDYYYRFETHDLQNGVLTITHRAFHSRTAGQLGSPCALQEVPEWATLPETVSFAVDRPIFGFYKNPLPNDIDGSPCGVSVFEIATELIKKADVQFGRLEWEFESGERAVHVDVTALEPRPVKDKDGKISYKTPKLNKRLYRAMDLQAGDGMDLFDVFSPEFRDASIRAGLEEFKRSIEFNVGLAYGDLSTPAMVEKTASEVMTARQRKYATVTAIQAKLEECLEGLVFGLAFMNGMVHSGYEFSCTFEDSILTDDAERRAIDRQDVAMNVMTPLEYRMKWYGEDEATAAAHLPAPEPDVIA